MERRIIAMGYPSTRFESFYRNKITDVEAGMEVKIRLRVC